ncbi:MAG: hypothetical protein D6820_00415, partial [Lentisphaerae bacterium]
KKEEERIKELSNPVRIGQHIKVTYQELRQWRTFEGRLNEIRGRSVLIGYKTISFTDLSPWDQLRLSFVGQPALLQKKIQEMKKALELKRKRYIANYVKIKMEEAGYTSKFFKKTISWKGRYWWLKDLGEGTLHVRASEYAQGAEHMKGFVEIVMTYKGDLPLGAILSLPMPNNKSITLCEAGFEKVEGGEMKVRLWREARSYLLKSELGVKGYFLNHLAKRAVITVFLPGYGQYTLKINSRKGTKQRIDTLPCPQCWGEKEVTPVKIPELREEIGAFLKNIHATPALSRKVYAIADPYINTESGKKAVCPTCNGKGDITGKNALRYNVFLGFYLSRNSLKELDHKELISSYQTFQKQRPNPDLITRYREKVSQDIVKDIKQRQKQHVLEECKKLCSEYLSDLRKRMYRTLEDRFSWLSAEAIRQRLQPRLPGSGFFMLAGKADGGYLPEHVEGKACRRFTEWKQVRHFRSFGGIEEGYSVTLMYYRLIEIGGKPLAATKEKTDQRHPGAPVPPEEDPRMMMENPGIYPPGGKPYPPRQRGGQPETIEDTETIPDDLLERQYVFQYSIRISNSSPNPLDVNVALKVNLSPAEDDKGAVIFPLQPEEEKIVLNDNFTVRNGWRGDLIGQKIITFNQMAADFSDRDIQVKVKVTKKK